MTPHTSGQRLSQLRLGAQEPFIPVSEPMLDGNERQYLLESLTSNWISSAGPHVEMFEAAFARCCGTQYGVACSSGTAALHLALVSLGIGSGDEVLVPCFNLIVGVTTVLWVGAVPVLVDADPVTWCVDASQLEAHVSPRTKAILAVHLYGHPCDMEAILAVAKRHRLHVIEDGAQAHGAESRGRRVGGIGDVGCFSFHASKILTTGEGGMLVTNDPAIAARARLLRNQAFGEPKFVHQTLGFNYRMTNLQAAVGIAQCEKFNEKVAKKRQLAAWYTKALADQPGLTLCAEAPWARNAYWVFGVLLRPEFGCSRDRAMRLLRDQGIETRAFFHPLHRQPALADKSVMGVERPDDFPVADQLGREGLYLPSGLNLSAGQVDRVARALRGCRGAGLDD